MDNLLDLLNRILYTFIMVTGAIILFVGIGIGYLIPVRQTKISKLAHKLVKRQASIVDLTPLNLGDDE